MDKSNKSGAEALIHSLHLEGVDLVFGYPGGAALHIKNEKQFKSVVFKKDKSSYEVSLDKQNFLETSFKKVSLI